MLVLENILIPEQELLRNGFCPAMSQLNNRSWLYRLIMSSFQQNRRDCLILWTITFWWFSSLIMKIWIPNQFAECVVKISKVKDHLARDVFPSNSSSLDWKWELNSNKSFISTLIVTQFSFPFRFLHFNESNWILHKWSSDVDARCKKQDARCKME